MFCIVIYYVLSELDYIKHDIFRFAGLAPSPVAPDPLLKHALSVYALSAATAAATAGACPLTASAFSAKFHA